MRRRRRPTLHHAVKDKRVTVLGPVKQPEMDFMSHRGSHTTHPSPLDPPPPQKIGPNFLPGLRPIKKFLWRLWRQLL